MADDTELHEFEHWFVWGWKIIEIGFEPGLFYESVEVALDAAACDVNYAFECNLGGLFITAVKGHYEVVIDD